MFTTQDPVAFQQSLKRVSESKTREASKSYKPIHTRAQTIFDSHPQTEEICFWGVGETVTATYGQVVTVPPGVSTLTSFSFRWFPTTPVGAGLQYRAYVYTWNTVTNVAGSELYRSGVLTVAASITEEDIVFPVAVPVMPGQDIVIFLSTSELPGQPDRELCWLMTQNPGGNAIPGPLVFLNNGQDGGAGWTSEPSNWVSLLFYDFTMQIVFDGGILSTE